MEINNLAPIVLFVFNRPEHTKITLDALMKNELASESILYIYSDGAKADAKQETIDNVNEVRKIIRSKQWCKEVLISESLTNKGLATSIKTGVTEVVEKHEKVIVMEDDLLTSTTFLTYMNKSLDYYSTRNSVFSISAYNLPPEKMSFPADYNYDVYVSTRNGSWGWATWKNRWAQVDWNVNAYQTMLLNVEMQNAFNKGGDDMFEMLQDQQIGKLNIWSIQFTVAHFVNHAVSIVPVVSYVDNVGLDGSGENCTPSDALRNHNLNTNKNIRFLDILYEDKLIINAFYSANCNKKRPLLQKIINRISRIMGKENVFVIKKKIYC